MNRDFQQYLANLKAHGLKNNIPNVSEMVGRFLGMMLRVRRPQRILEIGCANGYSTLWMAEAARAIGARLDTIDFSRPTFEAAQKNITDAGFDDVVTFHFGDALKLLDTLHGPFDFVFVDGEKASYLDFWVALQPLLAARAVIIFDDMMAFPEKTAAFAEELKRMAADEMTPFEQLLLPIDEGDGIVVLIKTN